MPNVTRGQFEALAAAIQSHDFLRRILEAVEHCHRLVFHANQNVDWSLVRQSAEQILIADILTRHRGDIDGVYHALRAVESGGKPWHVAIQELAGTMHSYYTTPLGIVMRRDLFGDDTVFITPDAYDWIRQREGTPTSRPGKKS